jgi:hypothetical protein
MEKQKQVIQKGKGEMVPQRWKNNNINKRNARTALLFICLVLFKILDSARMSSRGDKR